MKNKIYWAAQKLGRLGKSLEEQNGDTPRPLPARPRIFYFTPNICWPVIDNDGKAQYQLIQANDDVIDLYYWAGDAVQAICRDTDNHTRVLRRLEAAIRWTEARIAGQQRAGEEIMRQQSKAMQWLEAEDALRLLEDI